MLIDDLKKRMFDAMKRKDVVEKEIVRTAIGETTATGAEPDDARVTAVLRKLIKSNEETLAASGDGEAKERLEREIAVLREFLPRNLDVGQIVESLAGVVEAVRAADNEGRAMGVAMKQLKGLGAAVDSKDVTEAVRRVRAPG